MYTRRWKNSLQGKSWNLVPDPARPPRLPITRGKKTAFGARSTLETETTRWYMYSMAQGLFLEYCSHVKQFVLSQWYVTSLAWGSWYARPVQRVQGLRLENPFHRKCKRKYYDAPRAVGANPVYTDLGNVRRSFALQRVRAQIQRRQGRVRAQAFHEHLRFEHARIPTKR